MILTTLLWITAASVISFLVAAIFAGRLEWERSLYLLAYIPIAGIFIVTYYVSSNPQFSVQVTTNLTWGLIGAVVTSGISVRHVVKQPASPRRTGSTLMFDLLWPGFLYGLIDAMLLSVVPVTVVYHGLSNLSWAANPLGQIALWVFALSASLIVTLCYHLGYPEYRGKQVMMTLVGNGIMTVAFLITGNPLAAVIPHCAMHIAAMWHGRETTYQLPPHYKTVSSAA